MCILSVVLEIPHCVHLVCAMLEVSHGISSVKCWEIPHCVHLVCTMLAVSHGISSV